VEKIKSFIAVVERQTTEFINVKVEVPESQRLDGEERMKAIQMAIEAAREAPPNRPKIVCQVRAIHSAEQFEAMAPQSSIAKVVKLRDMTNDLIDSKMRLAAALGMTPKGKKVSVR
jgi:hypothetical protein